MHTSSPLPTSKTHVPEHLHVAVAVAGLHFDNRQLLRCEMPASGIGLAYLAPRKAPMTLLAKNGLPTSCDWRTAMPVQITKRRIAPMSRTTSHRPGRSVARAPDNR